MRAGVEEEDGGEPHQPYPKIVALVNHVFLQRCHPPRTPYTPHPHPPPPRHLDTKPRRHNTVLQLFYCQMPFFFLRLPSPTTASSPPPPPRKRTAGSHDCFAYRGGGGVGGKATDVARHALRSDAITDHRETHPHPTHPSALSPGGAPSPGGGPPTERRGLRGKIPDRCQNCNHHHHQPHPTRRSIVKDTKEWG